MVMWFSFHFVVHLQAISVTTRAFTLTCLESLQLTKHVILNVKDPGGSGTNRHRRQLLYVCVMLFLVNDINNCMCARSIKSARGRDNAHARDFVSSSGWTS